MMIERQRIGRTALNGGPGAAPSGTPDPALAAPVERMAAEERRSASIRRDRSTTSAGT
jgi:hypothetical protein